MSSYIDHLEVGRPAGSPTYVRVVTHSWRDFTHARLAWLTSAKHADAVMSGRDPATQMDLARWNSLGRRDAA